VTATGERLESPESHQQKEVTPPPAGSPRLRLYPAVALALAWKAPAPLHRTTLLSALGRVPAGCDSPGGSSAGRRRARRRKESPRAARSRRWAEKPRPLTGKVAGRRPVQPDRVVQDRVASVPMGQDEPVGLRLHLDGCPFLAVVRPFHNEDPARLYRVPLPGPPIAQFAFLSKIIRKVGCNRFGTAAQIAACHPDLAYLPILDTAATAMGSIAPPA
jgi:hypothetical protein